MTDIDQVLNTAHVSVSHATLKVVVDDLSQFKELFNPRATLVDHTQDGTPIYEEDSEWKKEMKFPIYVISVSPWYEDNTLSVWVEHPYDLDEISTWLKSFKK
jgi:hypothetical protein